MASIESILSARADYSSFLVHLTRRQGGTSARKVLKKILRERRLEARRAHCLFVHQIGGDEEDYFKVVCFTEAPLHEIKAFLGEIEGRDVKLGPYGLVFSKDLVSAKGGNPAFYVNTYHHTDLRDAAMELFERARQEGFEESSLTRLLPFVNIFGRTSGGRRYDFYWEREWRVVGNLEFSHADVVVGLCPEDRVEEFEDEFDLKFISPRWGLDRIITHLRE